MVEQQYTWLFVLDCIRRFPLDTILHKGNAVRGAKELCKAQE